MSRTRIVLMVVVAGGLGLVGSPQAQAKVKARATAAPIDSTGQLIASLLANEQALITQEYKLLSKQSADFAKLAAGKGNASALQADILRLQVKINQFTAAIVATESFTGPSVNFLLAQVTNPKLRQQFAYLNALQILETNFFKSRPSATPFAA